MRGFEGTKQSVIPTERRKTRRGTSSLNGMRFLSRLRFFGMTLILSLLFTAHCLPATPAQAQDITTGLVGHWKLDDGSGTTATDATGGSDGTLTNGPAWSLGKLDGAVEFVSTNQHYIDIPVTPALDIVTDKITIAAWFKADLTGLPIKRIVSLPKDEPSGEEKYALILNADKLQFWLNLVPGTGDYIETAFTDTTQWHHAVGVFDGSETKLYLDGTEVTSTPRTGNVRDNTSGNFQIGRWGPNWGQYFDGMIDDVRVYNRALTQADIQTLHESWPGSLRYNTNYRTAEYHDGTQWIAMGLSKYVPSAVNFDGTNDYLEYLNPLTGVSDGKTVTVSFWVRLNTINGAGCHAIVTSNPGRFRIEYCGNGTETMQIIAQDTGGTFRVNMGCGPDPHTTDIWRHYLVSFDVSDPAKHHCYTNDVEDKQLHQAQTDGTLDFTLSQNFIGAGAGGVSKLDGDIADLWIDFNNYTDFSIEATRRKFIDASGNPVYLGTDGSLPTGTAPDVFLSGDTANWHTNKGTGGGFTENGALTDSADSPGQPSGNGGYIAGALSAHLRHTCALKTDSSVSCWGDNGQGQSTPPATSDNAYIAAGGGFSCTMNDDNSVDCWGDDTFGQSSPSVGTDNQMISIGTSHGCVLKTDSSIACWGLDNFSQATPPAGNDFSSIGMGAYFGCAVKNDGSLSCWGRNDDGQTNAPAGNDYDKVAGGNNFACALKTDKSIVCWGDNFYGQSSPPSGNDFLTIGLGQYHACALKTDGSFDCWGYDGDGQSSADASSGNDNKAVVAGYYHTCALKNDGSLACWGGNTFGEQGLPAGNDYSGNGIVIGEINGCLSPERPEGTLIYNTTHNVMQFCNGEDWIAMAPVPGAGGGGCSNPTGNAGSMRFNETFAVMQYCDGTDWREIGKESVCKRTNCGGSSSEKVIFATSATYNGNLGGLTGADAKCASVAATGLLEGTYKAWLSDGTTAANARLAQAAVPYERVDGVKVANNWTDLTDGTIAAGISLDERGVSVSGTGVVWTGSDAAGDITGSHCSNWTSSSGIQNGTAGTPTSAIFWSQNAGIYWCNAARRLYCLEQ